MSPPSETAPRQRRARPGDTNCWAVIGVTGDRTCPELPIHVHCRNCPVFSAAATRLLDRPTLEADENDATRHFAQPTAAAPGTTQSVVIFRLGPEVLALSTPFVLEVAPQRAVHALPHRGGAALLGITNVRGELLPCVSLGRLLGTSAPDAAPAAANQPGRLLIVQHRHGRVALPVDAVIGLHRFDPATAHPPPAAVARATAPHTRAMFTWKDQPVGWLDETRVFADVDRCLA